VRVYIVESAHKVCVVHLVNWYELKAHGDWICSCCWLFLARSKLFWGGLVRMVYPIEQNCKLEELI